jgi:hypothetical protein
MVAVGADVEGWVSEEARGSMGRCPSSCASVCSAEVAELAVYLGPVGVY